MALESVSSPSLTLVSGDLLRRTIQDVPVTWRLGPSYRLLLLWPVLKKYDCRNRNRVAKVFRARCSLISAAMCSSVCLMSFLRCFLLSGRRSSARPRTHTRSTADGDNSNKNHFQRRRVLRIRPARFGAVYFGRDQACCGSCRALATSMSLLTFSWTMRQDERCHLVRFDAPEIFRVAGRTNATIEFARARIALR